MEQNQEEKNEEIDVSKPWMSDDEVNLIRSYLKPEYIVFEYGAGGSTIKFSKYVKEYYSVEHDFEWYNQVLRKIGRNVRLYYIPANVLDLKWRPVFKEGEYNDFKNYVNFVNIIGSLGIVFDVVLIDGRARVACALQVLPYLSDNGVVFIHDFNRTYYWGVLEYYEIEEIVDKLVVLRKKKKKDFEASSKDKRLLISKYLLSESGLLKKRLDSFLNFSKRKDLAVVCCYFNPCHYKNKLNNYKMFREGIVKTGVRFLTVELAFGDDNFDLSEFSNILRLRTSRDNIMWQKERLLNIGIKKLIEEGYEKIAWLDADIIFEDDSWVEDLSKELDKYLVCQVFGRVYRIGDIERGKGYELGSIKYYHETGKLSDGIPTPGIGWAARSEVLKKIPLYDCAILGGGDTLIFLGYYYYSDLIEKQIKNFWIFKRLNSSFTNNYFKWTKKMGSLVMGKVGCIDHSVKVLFHGHVINRQYSERQNILKKHNFDPETDIKLGDNGVWEWASNKPLLHKEVKDYFYNRREDN